MGHHVSGVLAETEALHLLCRDLGLVAPVSMSCGFAFLPIDDADLAVLIGAAGAAETIGRFEYLNEPLIDLLKRGSFRSPLVYFETEYFGGIGAQSAAAFRRGETVFEPRTAKAGVINEALKSIGFIAPVGSFDAFDAVGLSQHRSNDDFRSGKHY